MECSSRAHRLSVTDEALLAGNDIGLEEVEFDDFLIYWRAIIIKLQSQTYFNQLIQVLLMSSVTLTFQFSSLNGFHMATVKASNKISR